VEGEGPAGDGLTTLRLAPGSATVEQPGGGYRAGMTPHPTPWTMETGTAGLIRFYHEIAGVGLRGEWRRELIGPVGGGEDWYRPDQRPQKGELAAPSSFMQRALRKCLVLAGESPRTIRSHVKIFDQAIPD